MVPNHMKEQNMTSKQQRTKGTKFYNNAIQTWTIRDVKKRNTAKENTLNYIEFWTVKELTNWLNNQA